MERGTVFQKNGGAAFLKDRFVFQKAAAPLFREGFRFAPRLRARNFCGGLF